MSIFKDFISSGRTFVFEYNYNVVSLLVPLNILGQKMENSEIMIFCASVNPLVEPKLIP